MHHFTMSPARITVRADARGLQKILLNLLDNAVKLTELHGGSVSVESTFGSGSRFTVSLPWRA